MEIAQPQNLVGLQWIIITVLAAVASYLFRELRKTEGDNKKLQSELLIKTLTGLTETTSAVNDLANAIEAMQERDTLLQEVRRIVAERNDPDG